MKSLLSLTDNEQRKIPDMKPGDTVRVHTKIVEGTKERIQVFEGVVLRVKGSGNSQSFTVRKLSYGIGVERVFLAQSPKLAKIEIKKRAKVRRAYLTYLRELRGKAAKLKDQKFDVLAVNTVVEDLKPEDLAPATETEDAIDAEITELDVTEVEDNEIVSDEVSTEEIAKAEDKEANAEDLTTSAEQEDDHQEIQKEEIAEGLDKANHDLEKGKAGEGVAVEKNTEDDKPETKEK